MRRIAAKVATVMTDYQIALNVGSTDGVRLNDVVRLHRVVRVDDPDTKENLGSVRLPKLNLRVNHVQERLCTAVVTDREPSDRGRIFELGTLQPLKRISRGPASSNGVTVQVGEAAEIEGSEPTEEDEEEEE